MEIIGIAASARYGGLKYEIPPVVYVSYPQVMTYASLQQMTYALRTNGNPRDYAGVVRRIVHEADARVPVNEIRTGRADINRTINQESAFRSHSARRGSSNRFSST